MKDLTKKDLNIIAKIKPSEFVERYCGIKLLDYQKELLNSRPKTLHWTKQRTNAKRVTYFYLLCNHLYHMKEDEKVGILKKSGYAVMNKDEFANYLMSEYWS